MTKKYGVGILGAGWVATEYVKAFRDHPLTEIVGMYSRTPGRSAELMQRHGVEGKEYASLDDFFRDDRIQIVASVTQPAARLGECVRAAQTGRHLVIEKPVGMSLDETRQIREAVAKAGVKSVTSFVLRWNPQFITLRALIDDGKLGQLIYGEGDYWHPIKRAYSGNYSLETYRRGTSGEAGGSPMQTGGCHVVDMVRYLGGDIAEVMAISAPPKRNLDFTFDPVQVALVKFTNGAIGKLSALSDGNSPYIFNVRLFGTEGTLQNNSVYSSKHYPGAQGYWSFPTVPPDSGDVRHHPFVPEIAHFMECLERDVESHASIYDSFKTMAVVYAIDESAAKRGQAVAVRAD